MPRRANTGATASSCGLLIVVAADDHDLRAGLAQRQQRVADDRGRVGRRRGRFEDVADHEHEVGPFPIGDLRDLAEHCAMFFDARRAAQQLADVPVGGVQHPH